MFTQSINEPDGVLFLCSDPWPGEGWQHPPPQSRKLSSELSTASWVCLKQSHTPVRCEGRRTQFGTSGKPKKVIKIKNDQNRAWNKKLISYFHLINQKKTKRSTLLKSIQLKLIGIFCTLCSVAHRVQCGSLGCSVAHRVQCGFRVQCGSRVQCDS